MKLKEKWPQPKLTSKDLEKLFLKSSLSQQYFFPREVPHLDLPSSQSSSNPKVENENTVENS